MKMNPWLEIPFEDYEGHMSDKNVGQLAVLSELTRKTLATYTPRTFALLGCCTGNGLEHIDNSITEIVYGIDINPEYLEMAKQRYENRIKHLKLIQLDINTQSLDVHNIDLIFAALLFEYVHIENVVCKVARSLKKNGCLVIVLQKTENAEFVSTTKYSSLTKLSTISKEVDENVFDSYVATTGIVKTSRDEIQLNENKKFIVLTYRK